MYIANAVMYKTIFRFEKRFRKRSFVSKNDSETIFRFEKSIRKRFFPVAHVLLTNHMIGFT